MKKLLLSFLFSASLMGYSQTPQEKELLEVDATLSRLSAEIGLRAAFDRYLDENAVVFPYNKDVLADREKIINGFASLKSLEWIPLKAEIAQSGELGYTYGMGKATVEVQGELKVSYTHYVSIWRKNQKGEWKMILDTGSDCSEEVGKQYFK